MIKDLTKENLELINSSFIDKNFFINEFINNPFAKVLIYIDDNNILGYLYYSEIYERVEINQFEVNFIHRNCGIGTKLLKKLTETVEKDITLEVRKSNSTAISLYKKFNFVEKAIRKNYYNDEDGILMERKVRE